MFDDFIKKIHNKIENTFIERVEKGCTGWENQDYYTKKTDDTRPTFLRSA